MSVGKRQKIRKCTALSLEGLCEAEPPYVQGSVAPMPTNAQPSPMISDLMEKVLERGNLRRALKRVKKNDGSPGIDGMRTQDLKRYLYENWLNIRTQILSGRYQPKPLKQVWISKPEGGQRKLRIPTVVDRFLQQAILQVLQGIYEPVFSDFSYGFRPGRSTRQAVSKAQDYVRGGCTWVVDLDLEKFFDRVNHDRLIGRLRKDIDDPFLIGLIRKYLRVGILSDGLSKPVTEGTPQGGPLSPLLSNIVLDELDRELEKRELRFVRYADDCNVYVRSERASQRVFEGLTRFIERKLKLKVNRAKSAFGPPDTRRFLGFTLDVKGRVRISDVSLRRFRARVRKLTRRQKGVAFKTLLTKLNSYLRGWRGYYHITELPSQMRGLSGWVRRRLRCFLWFQWKTPKSRLRELLVRGGDSISSKSAASSGAGPWRISRHPAVQQALSNKWFAREGLVCLFR